MEQLGELSSPIRAFVRQCCTVAPGKLVAKSTLFYAWKEWCMERNHKPGNDATFGKNLQAAFPQLDSHVRSREENRPWQYEGIELRLGAP